MRKTIAAISLLMLSMVSNSFASEKVITLINPFEVPENMLEESIAFWEQARDFLQTQPGYISTDLHQSIIGDARFVLINVAKWESAEAFMAAAKKMQAEANLPKVEGLMQNPALYKVIRH